jgi:hypothetical protein
VYEAETEPYPPAAATPPAAAPATPAATPPPSPLPARRFPAIKPVRPLAAARRAAPALLCLTAGAALLLATAAATGAWHGPDRPHRPPVPVAEERHGLARGLWHNAPADSLLPPVLASNDGGPGGAARSWTRIGTAPDAPCSAAALGSGLYAAVAPVGCARLLRATYTDLTRSQVVTGGIVATTADRAAALRFSQDWQRRRTGARPDLMPPPVAFPGTAAEHFTRDAAASWSVRVHPTGPWIVWAVAGFADGRPVPARAPVPAAEDAHAPLVEAGMTAAARVLPQLVEEALDRALDDAWLKDHPLPGPTDSGGLP